MARTVSTIISPCKSVTDACLSSCHRHPKTQNFNISGAHHAGHRTNGRKHRLRVKAPLRDRQASPSNCTTVFCFSDCKKEPAPVAALTSRKLKQHSMWRKPGRGTCAGDRGSSKIVRAVRRPVKARSGSLSGRPHSVMGESRYMGSPPSMVFVTLSLPAWPQFLLRQNAALPRIQNETLSYKNSKTIHQKRQP